MVSIAKFLKTRHIKAELFIITLFLLLISLINFLQLQKIFDENTIVIQILHLLKFSILTIFMLSQTQKISSTWIKFSFLSLGEKSISVTSVLIIALNLANLISPFAFTLLPLNLSLIGIIFGILGIRHHRNLIKLAAALIISGIFLQFQHFSVLVDITPPREQLIYVSIFLTGWALTSSLRAKF